MRTLIQLIGIFGAAACITGGVSLLRSEDIRHGWMRAIPWVYLACGLLIVAVLVVAKKGGAL